MTQKNMLAIAALAFGVSTPAMAQKYEVTGTAPSTAKYVYMRNLQGQGTDSTLVENGTFRFSGEADGKLFAFIFTDKRGEAALALLDGPVKVDLEKMTVGGSPENDGLTAGCQRLKPLQERMQAINQEYMSYKQKGEVPDSVMSRLEHAYELVQNEMVAATKQICQGNKQHRFPAYFLRTAASAMEKQDVIELAETGDPAYMKVSLMDRLRSSINGWKRQLPGTPFTDLEMNAPDGKPHKLSEYIGKGHYVLVDFWASWCGPCRREMPHVKALYEKYHAKGFDIVGLSFDNDEKAWKGAIEKMQLPWHHLSDLKGWESAAASTYGINAIPATLLFGPDGKVVAGGLSSEELDQKLGEMLK